MNFLAHIYLSGNDEMVQIGNFIADGIKGKRYETYPRNIQKGILLHRSIDTFTDSHPIVKLSTRKLHARFSHYSSVIIDVFYDHFLAKNWTEYSQEPLADYVERFYQLLHTHYDILPLRIRHMIPPMLRENWLLSYASKEGIEHILFQMSKRVKHPIHMDWAMEELTQYYSDFQNEFNLFFSEIQLHCQERLMALEMELKK
ncbi:acyl carrier protein phosphodiesterase [Imtechella halotolerans]|uniref:Acyl carrier protein phosphodiesterase n=1 Tax=Imtechella halotolerans K1 TaxID=946077 RepID=I0W6X8_9FLAO|nr:acyl carrier protein phosphodiesterase [Imtechella halotolerans]EID72144.1 Acyl carrier protein phosphodiesterase [Imtechella halotolerans K1]WMQ64245.1 acyl carrier protein phosphodiesterase [Imtechella halotolerans]